MKPWPRFVLAALILLVAGAAAAQLAEYPLAGNDAYLPPFSAAADDGLLSLYTNPAGLAMRPGEWGVLHLQGLRQSTDRPELQGQFDRLFSSDWSLLIGGPLAIGIDRGHSPARLDFDLSQSPPDTTVYGRRFWRGSLGLAHRFDLEALDSQLALGFAYRFTRSDAYSLDKEASWDLGALFRWRRWVSLGLCARNLDEPVLRGRFPGDERSISTSYLFSLGLRPRMDWLTVWVDILQLEAENGWDYSTRYGASVTPLDRMDLRLELGEGRFNAGLWLSWGGLRGGASVGNQASVSEGTRSGAAILEWRNRRFGPPIWPRQHFAEITLSGSVSEAPSPDGPCTQDLLDWIRRAREERDLAGILLRLDSPRMGVAQREEVRNALLEFRRLTGRPVIVYADEFDVWEYFLATAGSQVVVNPAGELLLGAPRVERVYLGEALERWGIEAQLERHGDSEVAYDVLTRGGPGPGVADADSILAFSRYQLMRRAISEGRRIELNEVDPLIARGRFQPELARAKGLVDAILERDQLAGLLEEEGGSDAILPARALQRRAYTKQRWGLDPAIALIFVDGVLRTRSGAGPELTAGTGVDELARSFARVREDARIRAVVLRLDSQGGSALASSLLQREILKTRQLKPVIVSLGNAGAGGAYFAAVEGSRILADRGSITGGMGAVGGRIVIRPALLARGLGLDEARRGGRPHADALHPYDDQQREKLRERLAEHYDRFLAKVSERRRVSKPELNLIGGGRIWSGQDAIGQGLLDGLGGLNDAVAAARSEAGIEPGRRVELVVLGGDEGRAGLLKRWLGGEPRAQAPVFLPRAGEDLAAWFERLDPLDGEEIHYLADPALPFNPNGSLLTP